MPYRIEKFGISPEIISIGGFDETIKGIERILDLSNKPRSESDPYKKQFQKSEKDGMEKAIYEKFDPQKKEDLRRELVKKLYEVVYKNSKVDASSEKLIKDFLIKYFSVIKIYLTPQQWADFPLEVCQKHLSKSELAQLEEHQNQLSKSVVVEHVEGKKLEEAPAQSESRPRSGPSCNIL